MKTEIRIKKYNLIQNIIYIVNKTLTWQKDTILFFLIMGFSILINQYIPIVLPKIIIDMIFRNTNIRDFVVIVGCFIMAKIIVGEIYDISEKGLYARIGRIRMNFVRLRMEKALTMDYESLERKEILDLMEKAKKASAEEAVGINNLMSSLGVDEDSIGIMGVFRNSIVLFITTISLIISMITIIMINPFIVLIMFLLSLGAFFVLDMAKKADYQKHWIYMADKWRRLDYMRSITRDFSFAKDIRLYGLKTWLSEKYKSINDDTHMLYSKHYTRWIGFGIIIQIFTMLQEIVLNIWLIYMVLENRMSIANFILYLGLVRIFASNALVFFDVLTNMRRQSMETNDYRTFLELEQKNADSIEGTKPSIINNIEFIEVSFCYPGHQRIILDHINLTIRAGEKIAIVGLNGEGKTTLVKLLLRLYEPNEGKILINGIDIREYNLERYFELFSTVFQNIECFAMSILENISLKCKENTNRENAIWCIEKAGLTQKNETLSNKIDTNMLKIFDETGVEFSGGEKQKLALARALYKNAPIVILDEPTAALDPLAEYEMYTSFDKLIPQKTAFYISHRLSSTRFCDKIILLSRGKVEEIGTHQELINKNGLYKVIYEKQAHYYKEDSKNEY